MNHPTQDQSNSSIDEDWLDKVLEQYWKSRHGMYNANQDDLEAINRITKDEIANKIVELILKDRTHHQAAIEREATPGWTIELPNLSYFQVKAYDGHSEALPSWASPLYRSRDLPLTLHQSKQDVQDE